MEPFQHRLSLFYLAVNLFKRGTLLSLSPPLPPGDEMLHLPQEGQRIRKALRQMETRLLTERQSAEKMTKEKAGNFDVSHPQNHLEPSQSGAAEWPAANCVISGHLQLYIFSIISPSFTSSIITIIFSVKKPPLLQSNYHQSVPSLYIMDARKHLELLCRNQHLTCSLHTNIMSVRLQ